VELDVQWNFVLHCTEFKFASKGSTKSIFLYKGWMRRSGSWKERISNKQIRELSEQPLEL
jgi:ABC-type histidine transport system ATPase subunit